MGRTKNRNIAEPAILQNANLVESFTRVVMLHFFYSFLSFQPPSKYFVEEPRSFVVQFQQETKYRKLLGDWITGRFQSTNNPTTACTTTTTPDT
jgi:hypothetical protein